MPPDSQATNGQLTELERKIVKTVIDRFLNLNEATSQKSLDVKFQDPDAIARLARYGLITLPSDEKHFPTVLGFQLCGDENQVKQARSSLEIVLYVLRSLFEVEADKQDFTFAEIEIHARKMYDTVSKEALSLGLYLATEFPIFDQYGSALPRVEHVRLSNRIIKIKSKDIDSEWDRHVRNRGQFLKNARAPEHREAFLSNLGRISRGGDRELLHAQVERAAQEASFQWDEIAQLIEASESEGLLVRDSTSDTFTLTDAAFARVEVIERHKGKGAEQRAVSARAVFVVHGRNEEIKQTVARFLEKLLLDAIILNERPNQGKTLIEKFEANSNDVEFAVVLLTPDDSGGPASEPQNTHPRARQNVILELGYFIGRLGRERVCAILMDGVETPSDIHGVVYVPYDPNGAWRITLAREIKAAGIEVDMNLID
jgi:predicted nucleotide-binding protein